MHSDALWCTLENSGALWSTLEHSGARFFMTNCDSFSKAYSTQYSYYMYLQSCTKYFQMVRSAMSFLCFLKCRIIFAKSPASASSSTILSSLSSMKEARYLHSGKKCHFSTHIKIHHKHKSCAKKHDFQIFAPKKCWFLNFAPKNTWFLKNSCQKNVEFWIFAPKNTW